MIILWRIQGKSGELHVMKIRIILTVALLAATSSMALSTAAVAETADTKTEWWPKKVDLTALRQNEARANPYGEDFNYAAER